MKISTTIQVLLIVTLFASISHAQVSGIQLSKGAFNPHYSLPKGETLYVNGTPIITSQKFKLRVLSIKGDSINVTIENNESQNETLLNANNNMATIYQGVGANLHVQYTDWDTSPFMVPIKIRPAIDNSPLEFIGEFTLGSYIGYQKGSKSISDLESDHYSQTFSGFAAPTMVRINPEVADTDKSNLVLGFSLGLGYIINLNDFQIGLVGGVDYVSGDASETWIYQGKPWFSFTVGFDFNDE